MGQWFDDELKNTPGDVRFKERSQLSLVCHRAGYKKFKKAKFKHVSMEEDGSKYDTYAECNTQ